MKIVVYEFIKHKKPDITKQINNIKEPHYTETYTFLDFK